MSDAQHRVFNGNVLNDEILKHCPIMPDERQHHASSRRAEVEHTLLLMQLLIGPPIA